MWRWWLKPVVVFGLAVSFHIIRFVAKARRCVNVQVVLVVLVVVRVVDVVIVVVVVVHVILSIG